MSNANTRALEFIAADNCLARMEGCDFTHKFTDASSPYQDIRKYASAIGTILGKTYPDGQGGTVYPLAEGAAEVAKREILEGRLRIGTAENNGGVVAVAGIVATTDFKEADRLELGRAGEIPNSDYSARGLLNERVGWILEQYCNGALPKLDFVDSFIRTADRGLKNLFPGGEGIQSIYFSEQGRNLGFFPTAVGWNYRLGVVEPFTHIARSSEPEEFTLAMLGKALCIPTDDTEAIRPLFEEYGLYPNIVGLDTDGMTPAELRFDECQPSNLAYSSCTPGEYGVITLSELVERHENAQSPALEVVISPDPADQDLAAKYAALRAAGFVLTGYKPMTTEGEIGLRWLKLTSPNSQLAHYNLPAKYHKCTPGSLTFMKSVFEQLKNSNA